MGGELSVTVEKLVDESALSLAEMHRLLFVGLGHQRLAGLGAGLLIPRQGLFHPRGSFIEVAIG